jgi:divalent metal cation (Fe/Co/Zn/Cd) transporter
MHASNPPTVESHSFWSRRWLTLLALGAGITVSLLAMFTAYHFGGISEGPDSDWLGLAFYLCGAVVVVTQALYLLALRRRHNGRREIR